MTPFFGINPVELDPTYDDGFDDGYSLAIDDVRDRVLRALIARDWAVAVQMWWTREGIQDLVSARIYKGEISRGAYFVARDVSELPAPADVVAEMFGDAK
jgi:hypothetical protein